MFVFNSHCFIIFSFLHFKLLNEKNDEEDEETRAGVKTNELLQQLMKNQDEEKKLQEQVCFNIANFISTLFSF